ncbi:MAG TPA: ATP-binding protein, partial [Acidobacteriota bacterium]|nr:ATP-binding protein [Acidobacteriota bacterium]
MYDLHVLLDELTILRQENEQLKGYLLEMSPDAVIAVNRDGKIVSVNQHAEQLFGYDRQELLGQAMEVLIPEQYRDVHHLHRSVYSKSPHFRPMGKTNLEFYALRKDGTVFSADINLNPVQRSGIVLAAIRDISQRKQLEQSLREAKEQAEAAARAKSIFLAGMTHEFRTPLNGILGFIQLLEQSPTLTADQQKYLAAIQRSGEHLLDIITDVLHMARIETGRIQLQPQVFDLHRFLYELETRTRTRAQLKHLQVTFDISSNLPRLVEGDAEKLRQILLNLLGNAVKFTVSGKVTLRVDWQDETAEFEVEDTGPGIAPEALPQIFEPFVQCKAGDVVIEGTGLGLAICRKFVELLGGTIQVKSQVGVGSTFRFVIPLQVKEAVDEESSPASLAPTLINYEAPIRLLVVDDKSDDRELLRMLLSRDGFDVRVAANGHEAVSYW